MFFVKVRSFTTDCERRARAAHRFESRGGEFHFATQRAFDFSKRAHLARDFFEYVEDAFGGVTIPKRQLLYRLSTSTIQRC